MIPEVTTSCSHGGLRVERRMLDSVADFDDLLRVYVDCEGEKMKLMRGTSRNG